MDNKTKKTSNLTPLISCNMWSSYSCFREEGLCLLNESWRPKRRNCATYFEMVRINDIYIYICMYVCKYVYLYICACILRNMKYRTTSLDTWIHVWPFLSIGCWRLASLQSGVHMLTSGVHSEQRLYDYPP